MVQARAVAHGLRSVPTAQRVRSAVVASVLVAAPRLLTSCLRPLSAVCPVGSAYEPNQPCAPDRVALDEGTCNDRRAAATAAEPWVRRDGRRRGQPRAGAAVRAQRRGEEAADGGAAQQRYRRDF